MIDRRDSLVLLAAALVPWPARAATVDTVIVDALSRYFESISLAAGRFTERLADGGTRQGRLLFRRPGRLRVEYEDPRDPLIVADGTWLGITDRSAHALDRRLLSRTPLSLLLGETVDLAASGAVQALERGPGLVRLVLGLGEIGPVTLDFTATPVALKKLRFEEGHEIAFGRLETVPFIAPSEFVIEDPSGTGRSTGDDGRG